MFAGALLACVCPRSACLSQVGQRVSSGAANVNLAGPVYGRRVAVLRGAPGGSWQPAALQDS
eukprot:1010698-Pyramimonas_sp.AAC.1